VHAQTSRAPLLTALGTRVNTNIGSIFAIVHGILLA